MARPSKAQREFEATKGGPKCGCGDQGTFYIGGKFYCSKCYVDTKRYVDRPPER